MHVHNLMSMKIGVFYNDINWARYIMNKFIDQMQDDMKQNVSRIIFEQPNMGIYMKDGSYIMFMRATASTKGYRFDKVIVEDGVTIDVIDNVIKPCLNNRIINGWML